MASKQQQPPQAGDPGAQDPQTTQAPMPGAGQTPVAAEQAAISAIQREAKEKRLDETKHPATDTRAGGRYRVNGRFVNADGKLHDDQESE
jgi:hypothetical protein